jgi:hypothetical protein
VIIVGADTPQYLDDADQLYAEAIKHTANVIRVYSPNATWSAVDGGDDRRERRHLPGPRQRLAESLHYDPNYTTKDGFGLNATAAGTHSNLSYYGEPYDPPAAARARARSSSSITCATPRATRSRRTAPSPLRGEAARRQLRVGVPRGRRLGGHRRRPQPHAATT